MKTFSYLPICAILNKTTFCLHGGLNPKLNLIDDISEIKRPINYFEENSLLSDIVWSDPVYCAGSCFQDNPRGLGCLFNGEAILNFLRKNSLRRIIRGHQCVQNGLLRGFGDKCITVFSASSYDKSLNNLSAIIKVLQFSGQIQTCAFPPIQRLEKSDAYFVKFYQLNLVEKKLVSSLSLFNQKNYSDIVSKQRSCSKESKFND